MVLSELSFHLDLDFSIFSIWSSLHPHEDVNNFFSFLFFQREEKG